MSLRVVEPGLCSLVVDGGRPRTRSLGVPSGGPADYSAFILGNALLGNTPEAAALEITLAGPILQATQQIAAAVVGAPSQLSSGRQCLVCNQSFTLETGKELHIGSIPAGARAYLCVAGGFQTAEILGSRCSLAPVRRDEILPCDESSVRRRAIYAAFDWPMVPSLSPRLMERTRVLRVIPGPEADWFPGKGSELYDGFVATVRPESNRMGLRLASEPLPVPPSEMVSQPIAPGAIQVSRDGQLILLGVDGQTIGGYPRIGHVISADFDLVGQLRPGDQISFEAVTLEQAERLAADKRTLLQHWGIRLREAVAAF
jgi:5-oxoprolinase (ATP-hydrolysing) subunit C